MFNTKLKCLQTDCGGEEYRSLVPIWTNLGIHFRHPCPHTHHQNGRVERKHKHVVELGLTMLAQAKMPLKYWRHAFSSAVFLINRLPSPTIGNKSPFQLVYNQLPNYRFLKVLGYNCFPFLRYYNRHKMEFRSSKCVFLGYNFSHKRVLKLA